MEGKEISVRKLVTLVGLLVVMGLANATTVGAAGPGPVTINVHGLFAVPGGTFTAEGPICGSGTTSDATRIVERGHDVFLILNRKTFVCDDGSGTFTLRIDAVFRACDQTDTSSWSVIDGTGRYDHLTGQGTGVGTYFPGDGCEADGIDDLLSGLVRG
jgi:hypothetical protein